MVSDETVFTLLFVALAVFRQTSLQYLEKSHVSGVLRQQFSSRVGSFKWIV